MALTGQLSDMSLAELIEFFCNQRKTGRLKVDYHRGHGVFFIKEGELVDAKLGQLSGPEAVYFALTLPNAAFDFSPEVLPTRRTIDIAWTQVVLEGLRRLDEGLSPNESDAFGGWSPNESDLAMFMDHVDRLGENSQQNGNGKSASKSAGDSADESAPLSMMVDGASAGGGKKKWIAMGAAACVVAVAAVVAIPVMRGSKSSAKSAPEAVAASSESNAQAPSADAQTPDADTSSVSTDVPSDTSAADASSEAARREREERERRLREQRERERRAEEQAKKADANQNTSAATPAAAPAASGPKSVRVSVTYDEAGRVTAASVAGASPGAEAYAGTAVRVARGRRFPAGKAGSTVITIPVN